MSTAGATLLAATSPTPWPTGRLRSCSKRPLARPRPASNPAAERERRRQRRSCWRGNRRPRTRRPTGQANVTLGEAAAAPALTRCHRTCRFSRLAAGCCFTSHRSSRGARRAIEAPPGVGAAVSAARMGPPRGRRRRAATAPSPRWAAPILGRGRARAAPRTRGCRDGRPRRPERTTRDQRGGAASPPPPASSHRGPDAQALTRLTAGRRRGANHISVARVQWAEISCQRDTRRSAQIRGKSRGRAGRARG